MAAVARSLGGPSVHRTLRVWAAAFVTLGAAYAFTGWNREQAPVLLIIGLVLAVAVLVLDWRNRR